ncbi:hypothetical protein GN958_ATG08000 [Phytophthora infestans]|uniref:Uncharacterized protein n=1 Tax=Phytophthora infestans TaxID=4787 RepID=A0A8S9UUY0_PHYIN|nr:hypothetical protein GN958_ATG08000 [Phytophthora infestans]
MDKLVSAASTARRTGCMRCVGCQGGKAHRRDELFQGKFQIKADCVDDLDSSYACSNVAALRFPTAMCKIVSAASTARRTARGRSVGCQGGKRRDFYGYAEVVSAASTARRIWLVGAASAAKAKGVGAGRQLSLVKLFQGKFQIKADRGDDLDSGYACGNVTALRFHTAMDKLRFHTAMDKLRFPTAMCNLVSRGCGFRGGQVVRSVGCQGGKAPISEGYGETPISYGYGEARERGIDCKAVRLGAQRRVPRRKSTKFQIKADRVDDLDSGYACSNVTALRFPTAMCNLVSAAAAARRSGCVRSVGLQGRKAPISYGYGDARERGVDCKAVWLWAQRRQPRRKGA